MSGLDFNPQQSQRPTLSFGHKLQLFLAYNVQLGHKPQLWIWPELPICPIFTYRLIIWSKLGGSDQKLGVVAKFRVRDCHQGGRRVASWPYSELEFMTKLNVMTNNENRRLWPGMCNAIRNNVVNWKRNATPRSEIDNEIENNGNYKP